MENARIFGFSYNPGPLNATEIEERSLVEQKLEEWKQHPKLPFPFEEGSREIAVLDDLRKMAEEKKRTYLKILQWRKDLWRNPDLRFPCESKREAEIVREMQRSSIIWKLNKELEALRLAFEENKYLPWDSPLSKKEGFTDEKDSWVEIPKKYISL